MGNMLLDLFRAAIKRKTVSKRRGPVDLDARWGETQYALIKSYDVEAVVINPGSYDLQPGQVMLCRKIWKGDRHGSVETLDGLRRNEMYPPDYPWDLELTDFNFQHRYHVRYEDVKVVAESRLLKQKREWERIGKENLRDTAGKILKIKEVSDED